MPFVKIAFRVFVAPSGTERLKQGLPRDLSSPVWTSPTVSACLLRKGAPALWTPLWPTPALFQQGHVLYMLETPDQDAELQVGCEGHSAPPLPAALAALDADQDTSGFLGCQITLLGRVRHVMNSSTLLKPFSSGLLSIHFSPSLNLCLLLPWLPSSTVKCRGDALLQLRTRVLKKRYSSCYAVFLGGAHKEPTRRK